jgi:hypothetical protein
LEEGLEGRIRGWGGFVLKAQIHAMGGLLRGWGGKLRMGGFIYIHRRQANAPEKAF